MYLAAILLLTLAGFTGANVSEYDPSQPVTSDVLVATGGRMTLTCTVDDHEESSLQWSNPAQQTLYFGEKRALRDNRIQLVKSTKNELSISISNVALSDEGEYTCSIFTMPVRTAKAMVTVLGVPQEPQIIGYDRPIRENQNAELRCTTSGSKPAANIRWYKGPEELEDHPTAKIESRPNLPREGDRLQLQCDAYGNPEPLKYTWMRKNGDLPTTAVTDHNSLVFQNLNKSDSGTYMCQVFNLLGDYIAEYNLDVNESQTFYQDPSPIPSQSSIDHAVIGGVVAVIAFLLFCLLIVLGRYLIRHKGTYLTHEAKGSDDAPDADTAIINAEGGQGGSDDKKEYFI